jgi:peptidoglycan hydrolase-like protein with peptidoglycan-binding domain
MRARRWGVSVAVVTVTLVALLALPAVADANAQQAGVQVALRALGLYSGPIDGIIGPQTVAGIRTAQRHAHLQATGLLDARTRDSFGPLGRPLFGSRILRRGDFGLDVSVVEYLLLRRGEYDGALDGYLGPEVQQAVKRFQKRVKLTPDGVVGPRTRAALVLATGVPVRPKTIRSTDVSYVVRSGDNLTAIAKQHRVALGALARANHLDPSHVLLIGTHLRVPTRAAGAPAVLSASPTLVRERLDAWAEGEGLSTHLVRALAWMESGFQPNVVSKAGARGVLQTLPSTRKYVVDVLIGHPVPETLDGDIEVGVAYLRHLLDVFHGNEDLALAAWYQGERAVKQEGVYAVTKPFVAGVVALSERM